jgi:predicted DNA-binding ribbon-helix-helix protein
MPIKMRNALMKSKIHESSAAECGARTIGNVEVFGRRTSMRLEQSYWDALRLVAKARGTHPNIIVSEAARLSKNSSTSLTSSVRVHLAVVCVGPTPTEVEFRQQVDRVRMNLSFKKRRITVFLEQFFWDGLTEIARRNQTSLDETVEWVAANVPGATSRASAIRLAVLDDRLTRLA